MGARGGRPARRGGDEAGFTLVELLVVMIIIGILAAIAVPIFVSQRGKANDSAVKADLGKVAKELGTYFVDLPNTPPTISVSGGHYSVDGQDVGLVSSGVVMVDTGGATITTLTSAGGTAMDQTHWCLALSNPSGNQKTYKYSAQNGLESGLCTADNAP